MFLIGLSGGIGSGKSTVSNFLRNSGIPVIDADQIAREVVKQNSKCYFFIRKHFGPEVINDADGEINRPYLAQIIFNDPEKRKLLNSITHPEVQKRTFLQILYYFITFSPFVVLDIPLLFESSIYKPYMSYTILVTCTPEQQKERIKKRNGYTDEEASSRISAQMPIEEKRQLADIIIDNSGDLEATIEKTKAVFRDLRFPLTFWIFRFLLIGLTLIPTVILLKLL